MRGIGRWQAITPILTFPLTGEGTFDSTLQSSCPPGEGNHIQPLQPTRRSSAGGNLAGGYGFGPAPEGRLLSPGCSFNRKPLKANPSFPRRREPRRGLRPSKTRAAALPVTRAAAASPPTAQERHNEANAKLGYLKQGLATPGPASHKQDNPGPRKTAIAAARYSPQRNRLTTGLRRASNPGPGRKSGQRPG